MSAPVRDFAARISLSAALTVLIVAFWLFVMAHAQMHHLPRAQFGTVFLGGIIVIYVISEIDELRGTLDRGVLFALVLGGLIAVFTTAYMTYHFHALYRFRTGYAYDHEYVIAAVFLLAVLYFTYREFGKLFVGIILFGFVYGFHGQYFPGILQHAGFPMQRLLRIAVLEYGGVYGFLNRIVATWVSLFILFAGLLQGYGMFDVIQRVAFRTARVTKSGVAQSAVIASVVIGSVNGSPTANAGMTGSFTIPMMKKSGLKGETAGGIEAVASCTGQVLPPVMGAAAFVMANLLGISYFDVILAGLLPALVMVVAIALAVHFSFVGQVEDPDRIVDDFFQDRDPVPRTEFAVELSKFVVPFVALIYFLGVVQYTIMTSAFYTCLIMIVMGIAHATFWEAQSLAHVRSGFRDGIRQTSNGFVTGAVILAPIAIILASINILVDILLTSGVPAAMSLALAALSGGVMIVAVLIAMVASIILGLGMPTTAAYLIVALLIAPALIGEFEVPALAAHYFVFYSAVLSSITPPIAAAVAVTSGIAQASFWRTAIEAVKIAAPLFVLPFTFIYHPELVSPTFGSSTFVVLFFAFFGAMGISYGLNYNPREHIVSRVRKWSTRTAYVVFGIVIMAHPSWSLQLLAVGGLIGVYVLHRVTVEQVMDVHKAFRE